MKKELSKNNKIKKAELPFEKMSDKEKDYVAVVLEEVRDNFRAFGESLNFVREKGDATFEEVGKMRVDIEEIKDSQILMQADITILKQDVSVLKQDVVILKQDVSVLKQDVKQINVQLDNIEQEVSAIRNEINSFKIILTQKADVEFLKTLEARLVIVERHLKLTTA